MASLIQDSSTTNNCCVDGLVASIVGIQGDLPHDLAEVLLECLIDRQHALGRMVMTLSSDKLGLQVQSVVARVNFPHERTRGLYRTLRE
jgi:hypothetical protein